MKIITLLILLTTSIPAFCDTWILNDGRTLHDVRISSKDKNCFVITSLELKQLTIITIDQLDPITLKHVQGLHGVEDLNPSGPGSL